MKLKNRLKDDKEIEEETMAMLKCANGAKKKKTFRYQKSNVKSSPKHDKTYSSIMSKLNEILEKIEK